MVGPSTTPQLPGYRDLAPLGRGGYSEVYRAYQDQFDRWVAVKVLTFALTDDRSQRRFLRECRVAGRLSAHPNIVTVYDAGLSPDGRPYISMELFDHGSIADRLRGGPFDLADVLRIAVGLAGALETAHRAGVVHRDVKPANVLLAAYGQPALTDFGLSILAERQEVSVGVDALTPYHAPPEVLERTAVTATSDVYSLASTTYAMLSGRAPHQRGDDQDSMASLLLRILQVDVPPIGRTDVPQSLDTTLRRALARDAHARTRTALDFARGVQQAQAELGFDVTQPIVMDAPKGGDAVPPPPGLDPSPTAITQPDPPSPGAPREPTVPFGAGVPGDSTIDRPTFASRFADPGAPAASGLAPDRHDAPAWDPNGYPGAEPPGPDRAGTPPSWDPSDYPGGTPPGPAWVPNHPTAGGSPPDAAGGPPAWGPSSHPGGTAAGHANGAYPAAGPPPSWPPGPAPAGGPGAPGSPAPGSASVFAPPSPGGTGPGGPGPGAPTPGGTGPGGPAWPDAFDGEQTVHRSVLRQMPAAEPEPERRSRKRLYITAGLILVLGLGAGGAFVAMGGDEEEDPPSTTTTTVEMEIPTGLTATESPAGVQLEWQGQPDGGYYALILSETEAPRFLPASGPSLLITSEGLMPDVGYCFSVASLETLDQANAEQAARAFSPPACIRGASEDTVITE